MDLVISPLSPVLGAAVVGVDLDGLDAQAEELRKAWATYSVLAFPQLHATPEQQVGLASVFGEPERHGVDNDNRDVSYADDDQLVTILRAGRKSGTNIWHTDATFRESPPAGSLLQIMEGPPTGGDTMWLSTTEAYRTLALPLQTMAEALTAEHGRPPMTGTHEHPVVKEHPVTGEKALYVNRGWTARLRGMPSAQSSDLLSLLCNHSERPEHQIRWSWTPGDAVLWDNRCTQHNAIHDYGDATRIGHRVILQ